MSNTTTETGPACICDWSQLRYGHVYKNPNCPMHGKAARIAAR